MNSKLNLSKADAIDAKIYVRLIARYVRFIETLFSRFYFRLHQSVPRTTVRLIEVSALRRPFITDFTLVYINLFPEGQLSVL